tara:strand:+ start:1026 stop:1436 length:411 start_codon:yes stop_codon:yes gene_type:complete
MAWKKCDNCQGMGTTYDWGTNETKSCFSCGNTGKIWVSDPIPAYKSNISTTRSTKSRNTRTIDVPDPEPRPQIQMIVAIAIFCICGYFSFLHAGDKIYFALGASLIIAWIAYKYYKAVLLMFVIAAIIWFVTIYNN